MPAAAPRPPGTIQYEVGRTRLLAGKHDIALCGWLALRKVHYRPPHMGEGVPPLHQRPRVAHARPVDWQGSGGQHPLDAALQGSDLVVVEQLGRLGREGFSERGDVGQQPPQEWAPRRSPRSQCAA